MQAIASDLVSALGPVQLPTSLGIPPDPWQSDVLRSGAPQLLMNCCRQSGKSTTAAMLALHTALYRRSSLVLLLSPSLRQSMELFRKAITACRQLGGLTPPFQETATRLEFEGGSRIVSLPGKELTVRGFSGVDLLVVDEAARVEDSLYYAVRPMLAVSGGRLVALSTPFGKRGWFFDEWTGGDGWERVAVTAEECTRIPRAFMDQERRALGDRWYRQEYECSFEEVEGTVFAHADIQTALDPTVEPLFP